MIERSHLEKKIRRRARHIVSLTELEGLLLEMDDMRERCGAREAEVFQEVHTMNRRRSCLVALLANIERECKRATEPSPAPHAECQAPTHGPGYGGCLCAHFVLRDISMTIGADELK